MIAGHASNKLCKDCVHFKSDIPYPKCKKIIEPIQGFPILCEDARRRAECGEVAVLFEKRSAH